MYDRGICGTTIIQCETCSEWEPKTSVPWWLAAVLLPKPLSSQRKPISCGTDLMFLLVRSQRFAAKINLFLSCRSVSFNFMPSGGRIQDAFENAALNYFPSEFSWFPSCVSWNPSTTPICCPPGWPHQSGNAWRVYASSFSSSLLLLTLISSLLLSFHTLAVCTRGSGMTISGRLSSAGSAFIGNVNW